MLERTSRKVATNPRIALARLSSVGALVAALLLTVSAPARAYDRQLTPSGQAAAQAVILTHADLTTTAGWKGGPEKPDTSGSTGCPNYQPKTSDLVMTGDKESKFMNGPITLDSEASVLATAKMVRLDWSRAVESPEFLPCLRHGISTLPNVRLLSASRLRTSHIAPYTAAFRVVFENSNQVRMRIDSFLIGRGRTEITLIVTSLASDDSVAAAELRVARKLASRIRA